MSLNDELLEFCKQDELGEQNKIYDYCKKNDLDNLKIFIENSRDSDLYNRIFRYICYYGDIKIVEWLVAKYCDITNNINIDTIFKHVCRNGHLELAKWLLKKFTEINFDINNEDWFFAFDYLHEPKIASNLLISNFPLVDYILDDGTIFFWNINYSNEGPINFLRKKIPSIDYYYLPMSVFSWICMKNYAIAEWLYNQFPNLNNYDYAFFLACKNGHLEIAKWLKNIFPEIFSKNDYNISYYDDTTYFDPNKRYYEYVFSNTCIGGHIDVAKWLATFNIKNINYDRSFCFACQEGHLEFAQWLIEEFPNINYHIRDEHPFRLACLRGQIDIVMWLKQSFPDIDHHVMDDWCYENAGNSEILEWLNSECYIPHHHIKASDS